MRLSAVRGRRVKTMRLSMVTTNVSLARLQLGNGLQTQTVVTMYRTHVPNQRVSLTMKTSSIGTACIAVEVLSSASINNPAMLQYQTKKNTTGLCKVKEDKVSSNNNLFYTIKAREDLKSSCS